MTSKRDAFIVAVGVHDGWNPLAWFNQLKNTHKTARMIGFAVPTITKREIVKQWRDAQRASMGIYGFHGTSYEMFDWTIGETYMKVRYALSRGPYKPIVMPPDNGLSNEAVMMLNEGDREKGFEPFAIAGPTQIVEDLPAGTLTLPFASSTDNVGTFAIFVGPGSDLERVSKLIDANTEELNWVDPLALIVPATHEETLEVREVEQ